MALLFGSVLPAAAAVDPYVALVEDARAAPVEIFADIAFRLLGRLPARQKAAALEDIFRRAGEAAVPLPLRYWGADSVPDPVALQARVGGMGLDALTLRCRAVQELLAIDPKLARELFEQVPRPAVPRVRCERELVPDTGIYIDTLAGVAERGAFTPREKEEQAPFFMVERGARGASGSWEIVAAARRLPIMAHTEREAGILASALAASLALADDDRAFTSALRRGQLAATVYTAATRLREKGALDTVLFMALRDYLVRHLSGARCEDEIPAPPGGWNESSLEWGRQTILPALDQVAAFNNTVRQRTDVPPISVEESQAARLEGKAARDESADLSGFRALNREFLTLLVSHLKLSVTLDSERVPDATSVLAREVLAKVEDWNGASGQSAIEVFHQKCTLLARLADTAPGRAIAPDVAQALVSVLDDAGVLRESPAYWLYEVNRPEIRRPLGLLPADRGQQPESPLEMRRLVAAARLLPLALYGRLALLDGAQGRNSEMRK